MEINQQSSFFFVVMLSFNQSSSLIPVSSSREKGRDPTMPIIVGLGSVEVGFMMSEPQTKIFHYFRGFPFYVFACSSPHSLSLSGGVLKSMGAELQLLYNLAS